MGRIRSIWPEQWFDSAFLALEPLTRLLLLALRNLADDNGIFKMDMIEIKVNCFPLDDVDIEAMMTSLTSSNPAIVRVFTSSDREYGQIRNFVKYQSPQKPTSKYPVPEETMTAPEEWSINPRCKRLLPKKTISGQSEDDSATVSISTGTERNGTEKEGNGMEPDRIGSISDPGVSSQPTDPGTASNSKLLPRLFNCPDLDTIRNLDFKGAVCLCAGLEDDPSGALAWWKNRYRELTKAIGDVEALVLVTENLCKLWESMHNGESKDIGKYHTPAAFMNAVTLPPERKTP